MSYSALGFIDRPLNPTGVPPVVRRYSPVGFDAEVAKLRKALDSFLLGNDNVMIVIIAQYGWGKSELLDVLEAEASSRGVRVLRVPLTFGLDVRVALDAVVKARANSGEPLLVLMDEADEVSRLVELNNSLGGDAIKVRELVVNLGTIVRALMEPRNYRDVLNVNPSLLGKVMVALAVTPQLYYNILRNTVPDVFDITRGRVFSEVVIDERMPLWLYEAMVSARLIQYSSEDRLKLIRGGFIDPLHPLKFEYLATLYELVAAAEGGNPSPRALIKFTAKLMDYLVMNGRELNHESFLEFLRNEESLGELRFNSSPLNEGPSEGNVALIYRAILLSGVPRTIEDLSAELGFDVEDSINALITAGLVQKVHVVRARFSEVDRLNEILMGLGNPPISTDPRDASLSYGYYFTRCINDQPEVFVVLPHDVPGSYVAYQVVPKLHRELVLGEEHEEALRAREEVARAFRLLEGPGGELASGITKAALGVQVALSAAGPGLWLGILENPVDIRLGVMVHVGDDVDSMARSLMSIVNEGSILINGQEKFVDALLVITHSRIHTNSELLSRFEFLEKSQWKVVLGPAPDFVKVVAFGSDMLQGLRSILAGSRLEGLGHVPREYLGLLEAARKFRESISAFRDLARRRVLNYTLAIKRSAREPKESVIRGIVLAWIKGDVIDQPEVFRDEEGKARVTDVEATFVRFLRSLGKRILSDKELLYLIRRLYPVHLWREFKEEDLVRLMVLRGLLLPMNPELTRFTAHGDLIEEALRNLEEALRRITESLSRPARLSIRELGVEVALRHQIDLDLGCDRLLRALRATPRGSRDFTVRYTSFIICLDELRDRLSERNKSLSEAISAVEGKLRGLVARTLEEINVLRDNAAKLPDTLSSIVMHDVDVFLKELRDYLGRLNGLELSEVEELLGSLEGFVEGGIGRIRLRSSILAQISSAIIEYEELGGTLDRASKLIGSNYARVTREELMRDVELIVRSNDLDWLREFGETVNDTLSRMRKVISEVLGSINERVSKYSRALLWLRLRLGGEAKLPEELPKPSSDLGNVEALLEVMDTIDGLITEISNEVGVPVELVRELAFMGPNVGIEEEALSKALGISRDELLQHLEKLWRSGLVKRKFVT